MKVSNQNTQIITEEMLKDGAFEFERFWLRPQSRAGKLVPLRLRINKRFGGWKLKDELVKALGLKVGDCINTEVTVLFSGNLIEEPDDTDLFADGKAADWLLDIVTSMGGPVGCVFDCWAELSYCQAPVGGLSEKMVNKVSLVLKEGIRFVENDPSKSSGAEGMSSLLARLLSSNSSSD